MRVFLILLLSIQIVLIQLNIELSRDTIITAIKDNGCASKQVLKPVVMRIDNYNIKAL